MINLDNVNLGFACICKSLGESGKFKTITVKSALKLSEQELHRKLKQITVDNLYNTYLILQWCVKNDIKMYRLSSSLIPLAEHELNTWKWNEDKDVINICNKIKNIINYIDIRISMHPDQFTILTNFKDDSIYQNSLRILNYHNILSELVGNNTLVVHVGGVYGDKSKAVATFKSNFKRLPKSIQNKIILENDDKSYNVEEVLDICEELNIRMCLDFHHDRCLTSSNSLECYIDRIKATWKGNKPKCHLSSGKESLTDRKHSDYVASEDLVKCVEVTKGDFDIMLECKEKDLGIMMFR